MKAERREQGRFPLRIQTKVTAETLSGTTPKLEYVTANISASGAFIETDHPLPLVSKVHLEFFFSLEELQSLKFVLSRESLKILEDERAWFSASGIVIRQEPCGMAVIFEENYQLCPLSPSPDTDIAGKVH